MAERGQADLLPRVFDAYRELLGDKLGICVVDVTTAVPLDDGLHNSLRKKPRPIWVGARCCASASMRPSGRHHHGS
ncbi:MAG: F0F1 ATP synthase subunit delta [Eggerthella lenta]